jgi:hypothetical protein
MDAWMNLRGILATLALLATLAVAAPAHAAGDPVASGSFELKLAGSLRKQLKQGHASLRAGSLTIVQGTVDPVTGAGELTLGGKLRFARGHKKLSYGKLTATLGSGGALKSAGKPLFALSGGSLQRNGFGADLGGVKLKLQRSAAGKIKRKLGLRSLRAGSAGSLNVSEQPQTVQLSGGTAFVNPYASNVPGTVAAKLSAHCIDPVNGVTTRAPATQPGGLLTPYHFPISGGTISPSGDDGLIQQAGGLTIANFHPAPGASGFPSGCKTNAASPPPLAQLAEYDFAFDLLNKTVKSHVVITNHPTQPNGDQGTVVQANLDSSNLVVTVDPQAHTASATGAVIQINAGTALYLNQVFPQPLANFDSSKEFAAGDLFATADVTATIR